MRRSARIAAIYGTEWSNRPSLRTQRQKHPICIPSVQTPCQSILSYPSTMEHVVHIPTRGTYTIPDYKIRYDRDMMQQFLNQANSQDTPVARAHEVLSLFQYLLENPGILFVHSILMSTTIKKIREIEKEIIKQETQLEQYTAAEEWISAALPLSHRKRGLEIVKEGMKVRTEERKLWQDLKHTMAELRGILPDAEP